jgi:hypothetical protein
VGDRRSDPAGRCRLGVRRDPQWWGIDHHHVDHLDHGRSVDDVVEADHHQGALDHVEADHDRADHVDHEADHHVDDLDDDDGTVTLDAPVRTATAGRGGTPVSLGRKGS